MKNTYRFESPLGDLSTVIQEDAKTYQFTGQDQISMTLTLKQPALLPGINVAKFSKASVRIELTFDTDSLSYSETFTDE